VPLVPPQENVQDDIANRVGGVPGGCIGSSGVQVSAGGGRGGGEGVGRSEEATVRGLLGRGGQADCDRGGVEFRDYVRGRPEVGCGQRPVLVWSQLTNGLASSLSC
jgi:hypothetical protein